MSKRPFLVVAGLVLGAFVSVRSAPSQPAKLPPISFSCPMDPDVIADRAGACPRCGMDLVPVRLDAAYSCPLHPDVIETAPGLCRICRRHLVAVTVSLFWTCAGRSGVHEIAPGTCPDGQPRLIARERRAHGDHNPRHGGQFFMASDNWHHLEGTYPRAGVFRLYLYDDFTRPIPLRGVVARAVTREIFDPAIGGDKELAAGALTVSGGGRYLEAKVPLMLPAQITAKVRFNTDGPEHRFDFLFPAYTTEPVAGASPAAPPANGRLESAGSETAPATPAALIAAIQSGDQQVQALLKQGALAQLYLPALAAKDAALALDARADALPVDRRTAAHAAVKRIVLAAWQIDRYGDLGDRRRLDEACRIFSDGVSALVGAYAGIR